jgi:hypothetical protein
MSLGNSLHQEHVSRQILKPFTAAHQVTSQKHKITLDQLLTGQPASLLYVPSSIELMDALKETEGSLKAGSVVDKFDPMQVDA